MISPPNRFWAKLLVLVILFQAFSLAVFPQQQTSAQTTDNQQPTYTINPGVRIAAKGGFIVNDPHSPLFYMQNGQWTYASGNNADQGYINVSTQEIYFKWDPSTQVYVFKSANNSFVNGNSTPTDTDGTPCWTGISVPAGSQTGAQFIGVRKDNDKVTPGCTQSTQSLIGFGAPVFANLTSGSLIDMYYGINFPVCNQTPGTAAYAACFTERQAAITKLANSVSCSTTSAAGIAACEYNKSIQDCLSTSNTTTASHCMALAQANQIAAGDVSTITAQTTDQQIADLCKNQTDAAKQQACISNATKQRDALANTAPASTADNCPLSSDTSMRWLGCSIFFSLKGAADALKTQINNYLYADPTTLFGTSAQSAANIFRNIGMVLVVIAGLFMVISQALGFEFLDAYTVRKLMPRLGVALIGMALAWPLLKLAVTLTNDLGGLINSVFMGLANAASPGASSSADLTTVIGTALTGITATSIAIVALGATGFLSLLGTVVLALLIGLLVLSIRQLVIFMLVIMAPLAIAAYVIPGGQKLWNFWKNTLITTLFMYPLIMGFISAGAAMAFIMPKDKNTMSLLAIIIYFAPYFMLPFAFKLAGGLMGTIFSLANDKNRGMFDRLKKQRQGIREDRMKRAAQNQLWDPNSRIQRTLGANSWASTIADPLGNIAHRGRRLPLLRKKGAAIESSINAARVEQSGKLVESLNSRHMYNDKAFRFLSGQHEGLNDEGKPHFDADTRQKLVDAKLWGKQISNVKDLQVASDILRQSKSESVRRAGNAIQSSLGELGSLYRDPEMGKASVAAAGMIGLASHGFANGDDLAGAGNKLVENGMNFESAQALVTQAQIAGSRQRPDLKAGYGVVVDNSGGGRHFANGMTIEDDEQNRAKPLIMSLGSHDLASAKSGALKDLEGPIMNIINAGRAPGATPEAKAEGTAVSQQLFSWAGPYSQASGDVIAQARIMIQKHKLGDEFKSYLGRIDPNVDPALRGAAVQADEGAQPQGPQGKP